MIRLPTTPTAPFLAWASFMWTQGKAGHYKGQAAITNMKDGKETANTHGIAVRK